MKFINQLKNFGKSAFVAASVATASAVSTVANAEEIDLAGVQTSIQSAQSAGLTTGGYVIAAVASLIVVGIIIAMIRKV